MAPFSPIFRRPAPDLLGTLLVLALACACPQTKPQADDFAATIGGQTLDGTVFDGNALRQKPYLLNFWASWCGPCVDELPLMQAVHDHYAAQDLVVIGINVDVPTRHNAARELVKRLGLRFTNLTDPQETLSRRFVGSGLPVSVLYNRHGREVWRREGAIDKLEDGDFQAGLRLALQK